MRRETDPILDVIRIGKGDGTLTQNIDEDLYGAKAFEPNELIFAYGSNMDPEQMKKRCPNSDVSASVAQANGWELHFPRRSDKRGGGVASIRRSASPRASVWGVVYVILQRDLPGLDRHEGVHLGRYRRDRIAVRERNGSKYQAWAYFAIPDASTSSYLPSRDYLNHLIKGARHFGLPASYIERLGN